MITYVVSCDRPHMIVRRECLCHLDLGLEIGRDSSSSPLLSSPRLSVPNLLWHGDVEIEGHHLGSHSECAESVCSSLSLWIELSRATVGVAEQRQLLLVLFLVSSICPGVRQAGGLLRLLRSLRILQQPYSRGR